MNIVIPEWEVGPAAGQDGVEKISGVADLSLKAEEARVWIAIIRVAIAGRALILDVVWELIRDETLLFF